MKFKNYLAVMSFCVGAAFTIFDIGSDVLLVRQYLNGSNPMGFRQISDPVRGVDNDYDDHDYDNNDYDNDYDNYDNDNDNYDNDNDKNFIWLRGVKSLSKWFSKLFLTLIHNFASGLTSLGLGLVTSLWIVLGGSAQFCLVSRLLCRGDARLRVLSIPIRILVFLFSMVLLGPVIIGLRRLFGRVHA